MFSPNPCTLHSSHRYPHCSNLQIMRKLLPLLRRCVAERDETERQWLLRVQHNIRRHRIVLERSMYGAASIDVSSFDNSAPLFTLHPHRKMLQLLQQHLRTSPTLNRAWQRYADLESISNWRQVAALDAHDFTAIAHTIHTQYHDTRIFFQGSHWAIPRPWEYLWRQTFKLDTVIGITPSNTGARRVTAFVPAEKLIGCIAEPDWIFSSPEDCRCLSLIQPDTHARLLHALRARMAQNDKKTSVIILCPDTHPFQPTLRAWCDELPMHCCDILTGTVNTLPLLRDHTHKRTQSAQVHVTAYWITGTTDTLVSMNDITSHIGTQALTRTIRATFSPPPHLGHA